MSCGGINWVVETEVPVKDQASYLLCTWKTNMGNAKHTLHIKQVCVGEGVVIVGNVNRQVWALMSIRGCNGMNLFLEAVIKNGALLMFLRKHSLLAINTAVTESTCTYCR